MASSKDGLPEASAASEACGGESSHVLRGGSDFSGAVTMAPWKCRRLDST